LGADNDRLLAEVHAGGAAFEKLVLTRNRRVMVSVGEGGRTLRLNECFRDAPATVLRAVGLLYAAGNQKGRSQAREELREFLASRSSATPPRRRARRIPTADRPHLERLRAEFERVNRDHFAGALPTVPIYLSGRMRRRNGHFCISPLEIVLSRRLCTEAAAGEVEQTLRHEMIHLWQHVNGKEPDHGREFRQWARRLGVHPRATRAVRWGGVAAEGAAR
jgi:hypothetical protein